MVPGLFRKLSIPEKLPKEMERHVALVSKTRGKREALAKAFTIITTRYRGYTWRTYGLLWKAFTTNPEKLWSRTGFLHCHHQNYLLRILRVKSKQFSEADIRLRFTLYGISPH